MGKHTNQRGLKVKYRVHGSDYPNICDKYEVGYFLVRFPNPLALGSEAGNFTRCFLTLNFVLIFDPIAMLCKVLLL